MSKIIKMTPDCLDQIRDEFEKVLSSAKISDGKISYTKTFGYVNRKAVVRFSEIAWLKMSALIREFDKEVAWHGVAVRGADETKDEYYIIDILVYPQEVTGGLSIQTKQNMNSGLWSTTMRCLIIFVCRGILMSICIHLHRLWIFHTKSAFLNSWKTICSISL